MDQPTREEHEKLKKRVEQLEQEYAVLKGQTEPIKITRLEIDPGDMQELLVQANKQLERIIQTQTDRSEKFDTLEHGLQDLKQELHTLSNTWLDSLQENVDEIKQEIAGTRGDILAFRESQADLRDTLKNTATKENLEITATRINADMTAMELRIINAVTQNLQPKRPEE